MQELGVDENWIVDAVRKFVEWDNKKKESAKRYYQLNKDRLDQYHAEYMKNNPEYRKRNNERAKKYKAS